MKQIEHDKNEGLIMLSPIIYIYIWTARLAQKSVHQDGRKFENVYSDTKLNAEEFF